MDRRHTVEHFHSVLTHDPRWAGKVQMRRFEGPGSNGLHGALQWYLKETTMKRIIQSLVLATLISTAQASPLPADAEPVSLPTQPTHADRYAGVADVQMGSAIPAGAEDIVSSPSGSTYADRFTVEAEVQRGNPTPASAIPASAALCT